MTKHSICILALSPSSLPFPQKGFLIFPKPRQREIHQKNNSLLTSYFLNLDCEPSLLLSSLNSDDSGTLNILPSLWSVPQDIIGAAFGDAGLDAQALGAHIPLVGTGAIIGSAECKKRCGIET